MAELHPKLLSKSVKKTFSIASLMMLAGLVISGCSASPSTVTSPEPATTQMKPAVVAPRLDAKQESSLLAEFKKIDPALDNRRSVEAARQQCRMILLNRPEEAQIAFAMNSFRNASTKSVESPEETAKKIITVIKNNGFCKPVE